MFLLMVQQILSSLRHIDVDFELSYLSDLFVMLFNECEINYLSVSTRHWGCSVCVRTEMTRLNSFLIDGKCPMICVCKNSILADFPFGVCFCSSALRTANVNC